MICFRGCIFSSLFYSPIALLYRTHLQKNISQSQSHVPPIGSKCMLACLKTTHYHWTPTTHGKMEGFRPSIYGSWPPKMKVLGSHGTYTYVWLSLYLQDHHRKSKHLYSTIKDPPHTPRLQAAKGPIVEPLNELRRGEKSEAGLNNPWHPVIPPEVCSCFINTGK